MDLNNVKELAIQGKDVFTLYVNNGLAWKKNHGFKVVAKQANSTIQLTAVGTPNAITLVKSTDGGITFSSYNVGDVITLANVGDSVILEAGVNGNSALGTNASSYHKFVMSGQVEIDSDSMNFLLNQSGVLSTTPAYAFTGLFYDCQSIVGDVDLSWFTTANATNAFRNSFRNTSITSVDLSSLTSAGDQGLNTAFQNCSSLTTVDLSSLSSVGNEGLYAAFQGCSSLTSVDLSSLSSVGYQGLRAVFYGCTSLTTVDLSNLTSVGDNGLYFVFYQCSSLTSVDLSSISSVGDNGLYAAFQGCSSLTSVDLSNLTSAGDQGLRSAFYGCTLLTTVYLSKLSSVGENGLYGTFYGCTALELVDFSQATSVPALSNTNAFQNTNNTFKIVVPDSLYNSWIVATNWSTYSSHIVKASEYTPAS